MSDNDKNLSYSGWESLEEHEEVITLEFDDGEEVECEILGIFEFEGKEYIALIPEDGSDDVYLYGYKEVDDNEFEIIDIIDDVEFEKVAEVFERMSMEEVARSADVLDSQAEEENFEAATHEYQDGEEPKDPDNWSPYKLS